MLEMASFQDDPNHHMPRNNNFSNNFTRCQFIYLNGANKRN